MAAFGLAIFSSAFLLFSAQPLIGKFILPWFGGAAAVWTACLLVFQVLLLAGYAYAWLATRFLKTREQVVLHLCLIIAAIALLPITPDASWKSNAPSYPTFRICVVLAVSLGVPFVALSATAPLLQYWFSLSHYGISPFKLYAVSNAGSLAALVAYPVFIEPTFSRATQSWLWSVGLVLYGLSCAWVGLGVWRLNGRAWREFQSSGARPSPGAATPKVFSATERMPEYPNAKPLSDRAAPGDGRAPLADKFFRLSFPACASLLLMAVTNKLCHDLAPVPLLWILPLTAYLATFILTFSGPKWYDRRWFGPALFVALTVMSLVLSGKIPFSVPAQVLSLTTGLFVCCTVCHGELSALRPEPARLPGFYMMISLGGVLGGFFVAVIAPAIFTDYFELPAGLVFCGILFMAARVREINIRTASPWVRGAVLASILTLGGISLMLWQTAHQYEPIRLVRSRNFYGVLSIYRHDADEPKRIELDHGRVAHGLQFSDPHRSQQPTLYYTAESGVGKALVRMPPGQRRIGVVGLGAGTLASYLQEGDQMRFYEINPEVERLAKRYFTFLGMCRGRAEVVLGDARLSLENEPPQNFDLLALDAFNGDAIPIHLLTREAFDDYVRHMKTNGVIALNISSLSLDLEPVVRRLAQEIGYTVEMVVQPANNEAEGVLASRWALLWRKGHSVDPMGVSMTERFRTATLPKVPLWTDDFNGLFPVMRWKSLFGLAPVTVPAAPYSQGASKSAVVIEQCREAVARDPDSSVALNNLACLLATAADPALRNGPDAVRFAEKACALTGYQNTSTLSTLAAAYAEVGRFEDAVSTAEKACTLAAERGEQKTLAGNQRMLEYYRKHRAFHQPR